MKDHKEIKKLNFYKEKISALALEKTSFIKGGGEVDPVDDGKDDLCESRFLCLTRNHCSEYSRCGDMFADHYTITLYCTEPVR